MLARVDDDDWRRAFRMSRTTFWRLAADLEPQLLRTGANEHGPAFTVGQQLATCRLFLSRGGYYESVAEIMHCSHTQVVRCVHDVTQAICDRLSAAWVMFPRTQADMQASARHGALAVSICEWWAEDA
jgi:hypothetical protein